MLVSPLAYKVALWSAVGVAGACGLGWAILVELRTRASRVPAADVVGARRGGRARWVLAAGMFASLGGAYWVWRHAADVVIVSAGPRVDRHVWIGATDHFRRRDGLGSCHRDPTWIVNQSGQVLHVNNYGYGDASSWAYDLQPGETDCEQSVDYVGPDHPPPEKVTVQRAQELVKANAPAIEHRVWLTWE